MKIWRAENPLKPHLTWGKRLRKGEESVGVRKGINYAHEQIRSGLPWSCNPVSSLFIWFSVSNCYMRWRGNGSQTFRNMPLGLSILFECRAVLLKTYQLAPETIIQQTNVHSSLPCLSSASINGEGSLFFTNAERSLLECKDTLGLWRSTTMLEHFPLVG